MALSICYFGDSMVNGVRDSRLLGWAGELSRLTNEQVLGAGGEYLTHYNLGIRGETMVSLATRIVRELPLRIHPALSMRVVISAGTNDTMSMGTGLREDADRTCQSLKGLVRFATAIAPLLVVGPPCVPDQDHATRNAHLTRNFANICSELGVPFIDVTSFTETNELWLAQCAEDDGFHPRSGAYQALASHIFAHTHWQNFIS